MIKYWGWKWSFRPFIDAVSCLLATLEAKASNNKRQRRWEYLDKYCPTGRKERKKEGDCDLRMRRGVVIIVICTLLTLVEFRFSISELHRQQDQQQNKLGFCGEGEENVNYPVRMATVGGSHDSISPSSQQNNSEIDALAQFAVEQHNEKEVISKYHRLRYFPVLWP